jgi:hypothetical protein
LGTDELSASKLRDRLNLTAPKNFRVLYLHRAIDARPVEMARPDRPRNRNQRYRLAKQELILLERLR